MSNLNHSNIYDTLSKSSIVDENTQKSIRITLSINGHQKILEAAKERKLKLQEYAEIKLLDDTEGLDSIRRSMVPQYYNNAQGIPDMQLQKWFHSWG